VARIKPAKAAIIKRMISLQNALQKTRLRTAICFGVKLQTQRENECRRDDEVGGRYFLEEEENTVL
jgi:hypothetical protein